MIVLFVFASWLILVTIVAAVFAVSFYNPILKVVAKVCLYTAIFFIVMAAIIYVWY